MLPAALLSSAPKDGNPELGDQDGPYEQGAS
jgi:hypothetical protein